MNIEATAATQIAPKISATPEALPCASSSSGAPKSESDAEPLELDPHQGLCEAWASWVRTRRFYKPPSLPPSILGRLTSRTRSFAGGPEAWNDAELHALNIAIEGEPIDALDRQVFELHYRHRVKGIKQFAAALGIGRRHWYTLLRSFEERVVAASIEVRERNDQARRALRSCTD